MKVYIAICLVAIAFMWGMIVARNDAASMNNWACAAEDEVVIINDKCVHIDTL